MAINICHYPIENISSSNEPVVIDTETCGWSTDDEEEKIDNKFDTKPIVIYFSWASNDPAIGSGAGPTTTKEGMDFLLALLSSSRPKIFHNAQADLFFLKSTYKDVAINGQIHDTLIMHALLQEEERHALKYLARVLLGRPRTDETVLATYQKKYPKIVCNLKILEEHQNVLHTYALADAVDTLALYNRFFPYLKKEGTYDYYLTEIQACIAYHKLFMHGIQMDTSAISKTIADLEQPIKKLEEDIYKEAGRTFNINSPKQLVGVLLDLNFTLTEYTPTGAFKADRKTLQNLLPARFPQLLIAYKFLSKARSTLETYSRNIDSRGRGHAEYRQTTITGRSAAKGIPVQQIPNRAGEIQELDVGDHDLAELCGTSFKQVRKSFIAVPNSLLICCDEKQLEFRVAAHFTRATWLIKEINTGRDFHEVVSDIVFKKTDKLHRSMAKTISFAILYGAGKKKIVARLSGVTANPEDAYDNYKKKFPEFSTLMEQVCTKGRRRGYVTDPFGRHYHFNKDTAYKLTNYLCQGTAANIKKQALVKLDNLFKGRRSAVVCDIHDDLPIECFPEDSSLLREAETIMTDFPMFDVKFQVDFSYGKNLLDQTDCTVEEAINAVNSV